MPHSLNICLVAKRFPILGRAADHGFLWPIAKGLAARGHKVSVLAWKNPRSKREIDQDNVKAYFLGEIFARNERDFPFLAQQKFQQLHQLEPFHLVHSIDASAFEIGKNRRKYRVAMMYDVEATEMSQMYSILGMAQDSPSSLIRAGVAVVYKFATTYFTKDRQLLNTADGMFATSPQQKLVLERHYLYPDLKTFVIPYGLEVGDLNPRERCEELKKKLKLPMNAQTIVTNTDMHEFGELKNLLHAFEKIAVKKTNARLIIVGNGPVYKQVEYEMLNLALGSRVIFVGAVKNTELPDYISLADVFVDLSSRTSGFEPSVIEAMVQKKVVIGSELSPISTIIEDSVNGFLIRPADFNTLSKIFMQIFNDIVPSQEIGEMAHHKVMNIFNTQKMVDLTLDAYNRTLENCGYYNSWWHYWTNNILR